MISETVYVFKQYVYFSNTLMTAIVNLIEK